MNKLHFLLRLNPFFSAKSGAATQQPLQPLGISRSVSVSQEEKIKNHQNLDLLRSFLSSFSNWKQIKVISGLTSQVDNIQDLYSKQTNPLKSIYAFVTQSVRLEEVESVIITQGERAAKRVIGL